MKQSRMKGLSETEHLAAGVGTALDPLTTMLVTNRLIEGEQDPERRRELAAYRSASRVQLYIGLGVFCFGLCAIAWIWHGYDVERARMRQDFEKSRQRMDEDHERNVRRMDEGFSRETQSIHEGIRRDMERMYPSPRGSGPMTMPGIPR
ncbi:MAG: hypothetical protein KBF88_10750 [Polyangiaceae bacterium]|nr:hypothetical protein [Polyangiaceae bacterium]